MKHAAELLAKAESDLRQRRFAEAVQSAQAAVASAPDDRRARIALAQALDQSDQAAEAAKIVEEFLRADPWQPDLLRWQATLLRQAGRPAEALPLAKRLTRLQPTDAEAHGHLGVLFILLGRFEEATACLRTATDLDPARSQYPFNLAAALIEQHRDEEAIDLLRQITAAWPDLAVAELRLGMLYEKQGLLADALQCADRALASNPNLAEALLLKAKILAAREDPAQVDIHLRRALEIDPRSARARAMLGFSLQEQGRFAEARQEFRASVELDPGQGTVYYGIAMSRRYSSDDVEILARLRSALNNENLSVENRAYIHYALGKVLEDQGDFEQSMAEFDAANRTMYSIRSGLRPFDAVAETRQVSETIAVFSAEFFSRYRYRGSPSELPALVLGMMRSGTTLVEQILSSHPMVAAGGEQMFWHDRNEEILQRLTISGSEPFSAYLDLLKSIGPHAARVTDKMPQNYRFLGLIHALYPNARIIHCRRHPVDTCLSIYATPYQISPAFAHDRKNIVCAYRQYVRLMAHWRDVIPANRLLEIDYEDLIDDRETTIRKMIDFLGLPWNDACLRHDANLRTVHTPSKWQVRQPIYATSVQRWKNFDPWLGEFRELLALL